MPRRRGRRPCPRAHCGQFTSCARKTTIAIRNGSVGRHRRGIYEGRVVLGGAQGQPPATGVSATPAEPFKVEIPLKSSWDESLTYAILDEKTPDADGRVFVGRMELLGPLVNAIGHPGRGGTYLISGYRGAGKTSLVIKAASQAGGNLPGGWRLLPLVLNVSQVSASLGSGDSSGAETLQISSRRLLTAMLRELYTHVPQLREAARAACRDPGCLHPRSRRSKRPTPRHRLRATPARSSGGTRRAAPGRWSRSGACSWPTF